MFDGELLAKIETTPTPTPTPTPTMLDFVTKISVPAYLQERWDEFTVAHSMEQASIERDNRGYIYTYTTPTVKINIRTHQIEIWRLRIMHNAMESLQQEIANGQWMGLIIIRG